MMNNLFKSALQGVVQRMATPENLQATLQMVQERFVREVPRSEARSSVVDAKFEEYSRKVSDSKFQHFPVYLANDNSFRIVYNEFKKQVFSTTVQDEALLLAGILDKAVELAFEAYNFNKLDELIETILSHQKWTEFHLACSVGCVSYISSLFGKLGGDDKVKVLIATSTADTQELPLHLAIKNNHVEVASLLLIMGADLKAKNRQGRCSYHLAAIHSFSILEKLLRESKSREDGILEKDNDGKVPLILAGEGQNLSSVTLLARRLDYELYQKLISQGSKPLHAAGVGPVKKFVAEILLEEHPEFIEIKDTAGNTPLISNVKLGDVEMVLVLIAHGANTNQIDDSGKTPLICAMEGEKISLMKLFVALGADYQSADFKNAISNLKSGAKSQLRNLLQQLEYSDRPNPQNIMEIAQKRVLEEAKKNHSGSTKIKLLSLDGGGIRGLASILVLTALEAKLRQKTQKPEIKLIDYFDWLAGTSTGAIIALGLVSGKSTMDVLRLYLRFRDKVFCGKRPYETSRLEALLQREFGPDTILAEVAGGRNKRVFVTTTRASKIPPDLVLLRNYEMPSEESTKNIKVWYAARCSSAAPTYFEAVESKYLDGGLMANNPCSDLLVEVTKQSELLRAKGQQPLQIGCVLSIGTGKCPPRETKVSSINMPKGFADILQNGVSSITSIMSLSKMFIDQICSSDGPVVQRAEALSHANGAPFFRITPNLATEVDLDSADDMTVIELLWAARCHCEKTAKHEIEDLVDYLTMN